MLSTSTKKTVDLIIPAAIAGVVIFLLFRSKQKWQVVLGGGAIAFLLAYLITTRVTKAAYLDQPAPVPTGGGCDDYDPTALVTGYYNNYTGWSAWDTDLLNQFAALGDCQLIKCYNYWNQKYFTEQGLSLTAALAKGGHWWDFSYNSIATNLANRFKTLNLQ